MIVDVIIVLVFCVFLPSAFSSLEFVHVVLNSGLTSPATSYPNDPTLASFWPRGPAQLSMEGVKESHELGRFIHSRYSNILSRLYQPQEVYMRSVDDDASLMSAQAVLSRTYPDDAFAQHLPVHTVPLNYDMLFGHPSHCPHLQDLLHDARSSSSSYKFYTNHREVIELYLALAGFDLDLNRKFTEKLALFTNLTNNLLTTKLNNGTVPEWATLNALSNLSSLVLEREKEMLDDYNILRLTIGPLIDEILNQTLHKVEKMLEPSSKMHLYSAPTSTLAAVLVQASAYDHLVPPSSTIFIELHLVGISYQVRVFYRNGTGAAVPLLLTGCSGESCDLEEFIHWMLHKAYDGDVDVWLEDCRHGHHHNIGGVVAITIIIVMLLVGVFAMVFWCNKKRKGEIGYREAAH